MLGTRMIEKRRNAEQRVSNYENHVRADFQLRTKAEWEIKNEERVEQRHIQHVLKTIRSEHNQDLNARRKRLADLLQHETDQYDSELDELTAKSLDRRGEMISRARQLREERERHRQELVSQKLDQQFQESCPQLHEVQTHMRDRDCLASQMAQMERRERAKVEQKEIDREFAAVWERDRQNKEERHQLDIRRKKELELEDLKIRDLQLQEIARRKQEALVVRDEERDKMRAMWSAEEEKARRKQEELKTYKDKSAKEFARFNEYRIIEKKAEIERNRAEDMKIVNAIIEEGRLMDKREAEKKAMYMREIREYRDQLSRQMEKEKIDDRHLDILRYKEQEKEWDKREREWEREEQLRAKLRAQVMAAREQQLREKKEAQIAERERDLQYKRYMAHQEDEYKQSLVKEAEAAHEKKQSIKEYLEWQLEQQQLQKDMEAQEAAFEREHARRTEEQLQQKINQTISGVNSYPTYYGKQKMGMYY